MAYQYRGGHQPTGSNSSTSTFTIPAGAQVGDLIICTWTHTATDLAGKSTPPTGWTYAGTTNSDNTSNFAVWVYWKNIESGDAGSTVTFGPTGITRQLAGCVVYYDDSGAGPLTPDGFNSSQNATRPALSTSANNSFAVSGSGSRRGTGIDTWTLSVWAERLDSATDAGTGGKSHVFGDRSLATPVVSGTAMGGTAWTPSSGDGVEHSWIMTIRPTVAAAFTGSVALSGSGTLTTAGSPKPNGAAALSGSGSLVNTVAGLSITAPAALSGSGTLSFTSVPKHVGTTALSGSGTLVTAGSPKAIQTTNYSGSGTLGTTGVPKPIETMGLSGSGTLTAPTRTPSIPGSLGLTGSGSITYAGKPAIPGSTALSGSGTLGAVGLPVYVGSVSLSGSGSLTIPSVIPKPIHILGLTGSGTLTIPARVPKAIVVLGLSGSGTLDADAVTFKVISTAGLSGTGDLDIIPLSNFTGAVTLSGSGQLVPMAKTFRDLEIAISEAFGYDLRISEPERRELNIALAAHGLKVSEPEARSVEVGSALGHRLRVEEFDEDPA